MPGIMSNVFINLWLKKGCMVLQLSVMKKIRKNSNFVHNTAHNRETIKEATIFKESRVDVVISIERLKTSSTERV